MALECFAHLNCNKRHILSDNFQNETVYFSRIAVFDMYSEAAYMLNLSSKIQQFEQILLFLSIMGIM